MSKISGYIKKTIKLFDNTVSLVILFLLMVLIPLSANFFIYGKVKTSFKNEANNEIEKVSNEMMKQIDKILYINENMISNLQMRREVKQLIRAGGGYESNYDSDVITLQTFLSDSKGYNVDYKEFFLVFPEIDLALSSTYRDSLDRFFEYYYNEGSVSEDEWRSSLLKNNYAVCRRVIDGEGHDVLEFIYQIPLYGSRNVDAAVIIRVDYSLFETIIDGYSDNSEAVFYIYDRQGDEVFHSVGAENYPIPIIDEHNLANADEFKANTCIKVSPSSRFTYLSLFPDSVYGRKMKYINILNALNVLFSVIFSTLLFYYILKKYLYRIKKTLSKFKGLVGTNSCKNEIDMINSVYREYTSVSRKYNNLKKNTEYHTFLEMLFKNSAAYNPGKSEYAIAFKYDTFCVGYFKILNIEKISNEVDFDYTYIIIQNIFEEIIGQKYCCYVTHIEGKIVVLFNIDGNRTADFCNFLSVNAEKANEAVRDNFDFEFLLYISGFYSGTEGVAAAYNEVCNLIRFKDMSKNAKIKKRVISNGDSGSEEMKRTHELFEKTKTLIGLMEYGDYKSAENLLNSVAENYIAKMDFDVIRMFIFNLEGELLKFIHNLNSENADEYYKELCGLAGSNAGSEFFTELLSLIGKLCDEKKENKPDKKSREEEKRKMRTENDAAVQEIISNIIEYINDNYADNDLNIALIGDYFNIAPYYISNQFKKIMDISMVDYINKVRVEKAKEIMEQTDIPVSQIAVDVGFNNIRTFMRAFMKYESVTPGKYRKIKKK